MSLSTNNSMSPADFKALLGDYGNNRNDNDLLNGGGGYFFWIIMIFLIMIIGGANGMNNQGPTYVPVPQNNTPSQAFYADMYAGQSVQRGFDQASIMNALGDISVGQVNGFANTQQSLCSGFGNLSSTVTNGFSQAEIAANARQMADMQQAFNAQITALQSANSLQSSLDNCCCENRAATQDLKYTVATEACNNRTALAEAFRSINDNVNNKTQMIIDKMCQSELDAERRENANLRSQIQLMQLTNTQDNQTNLINANNNANTATILAGQRTIGNEIEQYVNPTAKPAYIVQNPNGCNCQNYQGYPQACVGNF